MSIADRQHQAVIDRLQRALHEIALCETWLQHNAPVLTDHQAQANTAVDRALALTRAQTEETRHVQ